MPRNLFENHDEEEPEGVEPWSGLIEVPTTVPQENIRGLWEEEDRVVDAIQRRHQNMLNMLEADRKNALKKEPE